MGRKQYIGRRSQAVGATGEKIAMMALQAHGVEMVEHIATPFVVVDRREGGWLRIRYKESVSGDLRGILPGGRRVLAEVKVVNDGRLRWNRLQPHQVQALNDNHALGGVSLLVMVHIYGYHVMRWPVEGFGPRTSILVADAYKHEWDGVS